MISGKYEVARKKTGPDIKRVLSDEDESSFSPFSAIVLREKKEEKKKNSAPSGKKPGEIVHGYNPSLSFGDILSSYERTGEPYSMPHRSSSQPVSFGDILDKWENGGKRKKTAAGERKSSYTATRNFGDILSQYEGIYREKKTEREDDNGKRASRTGQDAGRSGEKASQGKTVEKGRKEYGRTGSHYSSSVPFSEILEKYDQKTAERKKDDVRSPLLPEIQHEEVIGNDFFIRDDEESVPDNVSWSVLGGRNENFVRPEEEKRETHPETGKNVRHSKPYEPKTDFARILNEYDSAKRKSVKPLPPAENEGKTEETEIREEARFFIKDDEITVPDNVSWSVLGGANRNYERPPSEEKESAAASGMEEKKSVRVSPLYQAKTPFSSILSSYEKTGGKEREKTFLEIMKEKGDGKHTRTALSMNELRRMDVQSTLDLHGETQKRSGEMIQEFILQSVSHGLRKVAVITGKGLHSESGSGVLRDLALSLLSSSPYVQEVAPAPLNKGGAGALWVILREKSDEK